MATNEMRAWLEEKITRDTEWLKHLDALDVDETSPSYSETKYNIGIYQAILAALSGPSGEERELSLRDFNDLVRHTEETQFRLPAWRARDDKIRDLILGHSALGPSEEERRRLAIQLEVHYLVQLRLDMADWEKAEVKQAFEDLDKIRALILGHALEGEKEG